MAAGAGALRDRGSETFRRDSAALNRLRIARPTAPLPAPTRASAASRPPVRTRTSRRVASADVAGDSGAWWPSPTDAGSGDVPSISGRTATWASQSVSAPAAAPIRLGIASSIEPPARCDEAARAPTTPKMPMPINPIRRRTANATAPMVAAYTSSVAPMPISRAGLSFVPNVSIAKSFTNGGTLSITRSPTSMIGERHERDTPATSSATPSATSAATRPAAAPIAAIQRVESAFMPVVRAPTHFGSLDFEELPQTLGTLRMTQLGQRLRLDLADPLAGHAELLADLFERLGPTAVETEAQPDDLLLSIGQLPEHLGDRLVQHHPGRRVGRTVDRAVLDEVTEVRLVLLADRRIERQRVLRDAQQLAHTVGLELHPLARVRRPSVRARVPGASGASPE